MSETGHVIELAKMDEDLISSWGDIIRIVLKTFLQFRWKI